MTDRILAAARGSSPLARGLQIIGLPDPEDGGIIPARAGFTIRGARTQGGGQDHPRSRGVYVYHIHIPRRGEGSSPLARGLRGRRARQEPPERIIPARAGFTDPCGLPAPQRRDHPRSRVVYREVIEITEHLDGSSPLARGLRPRQHVGHAATRIIPARAGFTPCPARAERHGRDHPRSRGVYT
mgnify:CR=1 FL=1